MFTDYAAFDLSDLSRFFVNGFFLFPVLEALAEITSAILGASLGLEVTFAIHRFMVCRL
jgi:hypothetical protein